MKRKSLAFITLILCLFMMACVSQVTWPPAIQAGQNLTFPYFQAFDSNGAPLTGGLVYTYTAGGSTPRATYPTAADASAGTNANANPVVLDSDGKAAIYLSGTYKIILKTAAGVTLWTKDLVQGQGASILSFRLLSDYASLSAAVTAIGAAETTLWIDTDETLSATVTIPTTLAISFINGSVISNGGGAANLVINGPFKDPGRQKCFDFTGIGAVSFGITGIKVVRPEWMGNIDGTADQIQINAAINSFPAHAAGFFPESITTTWAGTVQLSGFYSISAPIQTKAGIRLIGQGMHTTQIYNANVARANAIEVVGLIGAQLDWHTTIQDMTITGNVNSGNGIFLSDVMYPRFHNLIIWKHGQNGIMVKHKSVAFSGIQVGCTIDSCELYQNRRWGLLWGDPATDNEAGTVLKMKYCGIRSNGTDLNMADPAGGVKVWNTVAPELYANVIEGNYGVGLQISSMGGTYIDNYFEYNDGGTKAITNITQAAEAVVTYTEANYDFKDGQTISIFGVGGMTEVNNGYYTISDINNTTHTFKIKALGVYVDSTGYGAYTTGGSAAGVNILMVKEGIGSCANNLVSGSYLAYGSMHLSAYAISNVLIGNSLSTDNPNLILGATSGGNQIVATRAHNPMYLTGPGTYSRMDSTRIDTGIVNVSGKMTAGNIASPNFDAGQKTHYWAQREFVVNATELDTTIAITITFPAQVTYNVGHVVEINAAISGNNGTTVYSSIVRYAIVTKNGVGNKTDMTHELIGGVTQASAAAGNDFVVTLTMPGAVTATSVTVHAKVVSSNTQGVPTAMTIT